MKNPTNIEGFDSKIKINRFSKIVSIATVYQMDPEWPIAIYEQVKSNCIKEAQRLKFPDGWQDCGSYESLKKWYLSINKNNKK